MIEPVGSDQQLAALLKQVRDQLGLTQEQLAEKLGVDRTQLSKYETGELEPGMHTVCAWACGLVALLLVNLTVITVPSVFLGKIRTLTEYVDQLRVQDQRRERRKARASSAPDPRIPGLIRHFADCFEKRNGFKPTVNFGSYGKIFKRLLADSSEETVRAVMEFFFAHEKRTKMTIYDFDRTYDTLYGVMYAKQHEREKRAGRNQ